MTKTYQIEFPQSSTNGIKHCRVEVRNHVVFYVDVSQLSSCERCVSNVTNLIDNREEDLKVWVVSKS